MSPWSTPAQPSCTNPVLVGGDTGGDGLVLRTIAPEIRQHECTATVDGRRSTLNLAGVRGTNGLQFQPPRPVDVFDVDAAFEVTADDSAIVRCSCPDRSLW